MGENLDAEDRNAVRTPMQWSDGPNGGFSDAPADRLAAPMVEGRFGPAEVNVAGQRRDPGSLLNWIRLLVRRYRECPELAWGNCEVLAHDGPAVLAHRCQAAGGMVLALHNLDEAGTEVELRLGAEAAGARLVDLLTAGRPDGVEVGEGGVVRLDLEGYGCRWLRLVRPGDRLLV